MDALRRAAREHDISMSELVRRTLREKLETLSTTGRASKE
jgi:hypothetical protein